MESVIINIGPAVTEYGACRDQYWTFEDQHGTCMDHCGPEGINLGLNITTMEAVGTNMGPVDDQHRVI